MPDTTTQRIKGQGLKTPPGPKGRPLVGSLPDIRRDPLGFLSGLARDYGDIARFRFFLWDGFLLNHPDYVRHVLVTNNRNYNKQTISYQVLRPIVGQGLLTSDGELWLRQRRLAQPAFHRQRIHSFGELMTASAEEMLARWESLPGEQALDISEEMMRVTLSIVGKALFSQEISGEADVVGQAFSFANAYISHRIRSFFAAPLSWPTPANRRFHKAQQALQEVVQGIIAERREAVEAGQAAGQQDGQADLLGMLLEAVDEQTGLGMSDQQLQDEVMTLLLAGHETTANALTWTFYLLSQNPGAEARLHTELQEVLGERTPSTGDLRDLPYTRMVVQEALRLYPPAWIITRKCEDGDVIDGYEIPAGGGGRPVPVPDAPPPGLLGRP